jgi:hypothetical protein
VLQVPELWHVAVAGPAFASAERSERVDERGHTVVRELGRKRAAEKAVSRAIDDAHMAAGVDPMETNRRNALFPAGLIRRARMVGHGLAWRSGR